MFDESYTGGGGEYFGLQQIVNTSNYTSTAGREMHCILMFACDREDASKGKKMSLVPVPLICSTLCSIPSEFQLREFLLHINPTASLCI